MSALRLLSDEQMAKFLVDGYVVVEPDELPASFHELMYERACQVHDASRAIDHPMRRMHLTADNFRAHIAETETLFQTPTVAGGLTSILGPGYGLHPHHYVHEAPHMDQPFHQDGNLPWDERGFYRSHRPNWVTFFYYPREVDDLNGPTEVLPGSQYWTTDHETLDRWHAGDPIDRSGGGFDPAQVHDPAYRDRRLQESVDSLGITGVERRRLHVAPGSVALMHYDLMHRGSCAMDERRRFGFKFYFFRTVDPSGASWDNRSEEPVLEGARPSARNVVRRAWHWARSDRDWAPQVKRTDQLDVIRGDAAEDERTDAAYEIGWLAREDRSVLGELGGLLTDDREAVRRAAGHAAGVAGAVAEGVLSEALDNARPSVRRVAVAASGEARLSSPRIAEKLLTALRADPDDLVRSNAAYALGQIARVAPERVPAAALLNRLDRAVEPDNTTNGSMPRSTVRETATFALTQLAAAGTLTDQHLAQLAATGLRDPDRYVSGLSVDVFRRSAPSWVAPVLARLEASRYFGVPEPVA